MNDTALLAESLAADRGHTVAQLALAWVIHQGQDVVPIPGTKRRRYLEQNLGATDVVLTDADLAEIEAISPIDGVAGERWSSPAVAAAMSGGRPSMTRHLADEHDAVGERPGAGISPPVEPTFRDR